MDFQDRPRSESGRHEPLAEPDEEHRREVVAGLSQCLPLLLRVLRTRAPIGGSAFNVLQELHHGLVDLLKRHHKIDLKLSIQGLSYGKDLAVAMSPKEDPALFRAFQHGIRQLSFLRGLPIDELAALVEVLTSELRQVHEVEDDLSILLADREFEFIHFVVIETFSDRAGGADRSQMKAAELADVVAAALRRTLSQNPDIVGQTSGGTVRFWSADVTFFSDDTLTDLISKLPRSPAEAAAARPHDDDEINALGEELEAGLSRWTPWLVNSALDVCQGADDEGIAAISTMLGSQLLSDARSLGLAEVGSQLEVIGRKLARGQAPPALAGAVFSHGLGILALAAIKDGNRSALDTASLVLRRLPPGERAKTLKELAALPPAAPRQRAIVTVMTTEPAPIAAATELIAGLDVEAAEATLKLLRDEPLDDERLAFHRAALENAAPRVRALSLCWLARRGGEGAEPALRRALNDPDEKVRGAALCLLVEGEPSFGAALVREWFNSASFKKLGMDEKRRGALVLVHLAGDSVASQMRKLMRKLNVTGDVRLDELRAAAVAALGVLGDRSSEKKIGKLARSRLCGPALSDEAKHVAAALKAGRAPYSPAPKVLHKLAAELDLAPALPGEETRDSLADFPRLSLFDQAPPSTLDDGGHGDDRPRSSSAPDAPGDRRSRPTSPSPARPPEAERTGDRRPSHTAPARPAAMSGFHEPTAPHASPVKNDRRSPWPNGPDGVATAPYDPDVDGDRSEGPSSSAGLVAAPPPELVAELLRSYSFDDLPIYGSRMLGE